jgi:altronate hydrolase
MDCADAGGPPHPLIRLGAGDNVVIARVPLSLGQRVASEAITVRAQVPAGHKIAAAAIARGEPVRKYGAVIGIASRDIAPGEHVHTHNLACPAIDADPAFGADVRPVDFVAPAERATFLGIVRPDGRVATRNFIGLLSSVAHRIAPVREGSFAERSRASAGSAARS